VKSTSFWYLGVIDFVGKLARSCSWPIDVELLVVAWLSSSVTREGQERHLLPGAAFWRRQIEVRIRVARWPVFHRPGRYFTANLAEAGKTPVF